MITSWVGVMVVALLAYTVKAMTGFGSAIVLISLGALFFPAQELIPVVALLDLVACLMLMRKDWQPGAVSFWGPASTTMVIGAITGAILLKVLAPSTLTLLLGGGIMLLGGWLFFGRTDQAKLIDKVPTKPASSDLVVTSLAGFTGGLFGMSGRSSCGTLDAAITRRPFAASSSPSSFLRASPASSLMRSWG